MSVNFRPAQSVSESAMRDTVEKAVVVFSDDKQSLQPGDTIEPGEKLSEIQLKGSEEFTYILKVLEDGAYVLFTEHHPDEFEAFVTDSNGNRIEALYSREYKPDHEHDEEVTSVGINTPGDLDLEKFQTWMRELLANQGPDIFRMKGVLSFNGQEERYVFQGVHMIFDGRMDRPWLPGERSNSLIFIGRNLDRKFLNDGFNSCLI